jgi:16S rRNA G966 N2-methylase RsmD
MFSYYGSKSKIVQYYPQPTHNKIIEPFAGSARYSLRYFEKDVLLVDKYKVIVDIWHYLQRASEKDILGLPKLDKVGQDLRDYKLSEVEKNFMGMIISAGASSPQNKLTTLAYRKQLNDKYRPYERYLITIAKDLYKIKHWKIIQGSYEDLPNEHATWFIDPPYQFGGEHYKESNKNLDFNSLANWCKTRQGQVIVCENTKADWMDFKEINFFKHANNMGNEKTTEAIWTNFPTQYDSVQQELFSWAGGK